MESAGRGYFPSATRTHRWGRVGSQNAVPVMLANLDDVVGQCELRLQVPADVSHLRTVRLVAADAADRAGFDCDETDDLRIAVDEVCHAVLRSAEAPIVVGFSVEPGVVEVRGIAARNGALRPLQLSPMSHLIVDSVSDEVELIDGSSEVRFALVKRAFQPDVGPG
jgi:Histidine kinase-like ATPase domain